MRGGTRSCKSTYAASVEGGYTVPRTKLYIYTAQLLGAVHLLHFIQRFYGKTQGQLQMS